MRQQGTDRTLNATRLVGYPTIEQEEFRMPYVNIKVTDDNVTAEQKRQLIQGTTQLLVDILNKNPETTHVVIDEVSTDNWGVKGESVTNLRKQ